MSPKPNDDRKRPLGQTLKPGSSGDIADDEKPATSPPADDASAQAGMGQALQETLDVHDSAVTPVASTAATRPTEDAQLNRPKASEEKQGWSFSTILHSDRASASASKSASSQARPELPGFRILEELGRGEFGVVFKAVEEKLDRTVAIKLPLLHEASLREHYIAEARNAAKLDSPGIVTVYQVGQSSDEQPFVVQKYVDGHTLARALKTSGKLGIEESARVIMLIARAIAVAHQGDIVHRDLKPANILMDKSGYPWVADFGLAVFEEDQLKIRDQLAGTPYYMSPEQMRGEAHLLDGRTDIWALGIMLYECLCGKTPFQGRTMSEIREQILKRDPKPLSQRSASIPEELDRIFGKCCAKSPPDRYSSASQLADDLEQFLAKRGAAPKVEPTSKPAWQVATFAMVLLVVLTGGIFWGINSSGIFSRSGTGPGSNEVSNGDTNQKPMLPENGQASGNSIAADSTGNSGRPIPATESQAAPQIDLPEGSLARPLLVAADGSARFRTISAAIEQAGENDEIQIMPGDYEEHLVVSKPIVLKGARRSDVKIIGPGSAAIQIVGNGKLLLEDVTLSVWELAGRGVNAIELQEGSLELIDCKVECNSFSAINAEPGTDLRVDNCDFSTQVHPAIYTRELTHFLVNNSRFQMDARKMSAKADQSLVVGMQILNSAGSVTDCTFKGTGAMGIHWRQTVQPVEIENCTFMQLDVGIRMENCAAIFIGQERGNNFNNCTIGIDVDRCSGAVRKNVLIGTAQEIANVHPSGIKVLGSAGMPLEIADCEIRSYEIGLQSKDADLEISLLDCRNVSVEALSFYNSKAGVIDCKVNGKTGIQANGESEVIVGSSELTSLGDRKCDVGVFVTGGSTAIIRDDTRFAGCLIDCFIEWGKLNLSEVKMSGEARGVLIREADVAAAADVGPTRHVRELVAQKVIFSAQSELAIEFRSAGSYHLSECFLENPRGVPAKVSILQGLKEQEAENGTTFVEWD